ncbi:helix-turn-helix transcriptional regulator [Kribbella deserti]|uniref:LuxR C-terminal-related transcriptional regulator n=1 Tax=Kribbella deserti TaxID=1926257 RepID=A0ABV6QRT2_9ACTN
MGREFAQSHSRQVVLDAALRLQVVRARYCDEWLAGTPCPVEVQPFTSAHGGVRDWLRELCDGADELVAVTSTRCQTLETFVPSHRFNRELIERGQRMTSFFDPSGGPDVLTEFIIAAEDMPYHLACGPIQLKLLDGERVVLEGPVIDNTRSLMLISGPEVVNAAGQYLRAVRQSSIRASALRDTEVQLSARQQVIAEQLSEGCTDDQIAERLDLSVRTVRYEVARLLEALQVPTRFAAGVRYAHLKAGATS